ncbi:MAG TPA: TonB family protein [Stellaceae bacterium]
MSGIRLPLTLSIAGHTILLALLLLFAAETRLRPEPPMKSGIEVDLGQSLSEAQTVLAPDSASQSPAPSPTATLLPEATAEPEPAVATIEPPPVPAPEIPISPPVQTEPAPASELAQSEPAPLPPRKPVTKQPAKPIARRPPPQAPVSVPMPAPTQLAQAPSTAVSASQTPALQPAAAPARPVPDFAANYRGMISAWFEAHKHYPDAARQQGEEGSVGLRFRVDRFGRVLDYALLTRTGYSDLDAVIDQMMRGAQLPPFPAGMMESQIEVSLTIRFSLVR